MAQIELISKSSGGVHSNGFNVSASISADGRYVAFHSNGTNLVAGDTNNQTDVFVHDRNTNATERVSVGSGGAQANEFSGIASISADGRFVAFTSLASNLVTGDSNGENDIFVHDRGSDATERVSVSSSGTQANEQSFDASISADGRYVAFASLASNLVPGDVQTQDVFRYDRQTDTIAWLTPVGSPPYPVGAHAGTAPSINADGRYVAFTAFARHLPEDTDGSNDIYVTDAASGAKEAISVASPTNQLAQSSGGASISADGRYVAFTSEANNLVPGDTNGVGDVFVYDRLTDIFERLSVAANGAQGNGASASASISADGRYVAFQSAASNLVSGDTNGTIDVFVYDRVTAAITRVSLGVDGAQGTHGSTRPKISADGRHVGFESHSTNFVPNDTNRDSDIFVVDWISVVAGGAGSNGLNGTPEADHLEGQGGNDTIDGAAGIDTSVYSGARSEYGVHTALIAGALQTRVAHLGGAQADGADQLTRVEAVQFADESVALVGAQINRISNLAGSRFDDVLIQNGINGQVYYAQMSAGAFQGWGAATGAMGGDWKAIASGDVNPTAGIGRAELFVQQQSTGTIYFASLDTGATTWGVVSTSLTADWKLRAVADLNGDASVDAIVQNQTNGTIYFANMLGGAFQAWGVVNVNLTGDWVAAGAGDVNRDGFADVIVQQQSTGTTYFANMAGGAFSGWGVVSTNLNADWKVKAVADVTGDGYAEVIIQNSIGGGGINPGTTYYADLGAGLVRYGLVTANVTADWQVAGAADTDNDGRTDVLFQNTTNGTTYAAEVDGGGAGVPAWSAITTTITSDWTVV